MSQNVTYNGVVYPIPTTGDENWGTSLTTYLVAIPSGCLQKTGGGFTLLADVNFGNTYGLLSKYFSSRALNPAQTGLVRLGVSDSIAWRDLANTQDLILSLISDSLCFGGSEIILQDSTQTLFNKIFSSCEINNYLGFETGTSPTPSSGTVNFFYNGTFLAYTDSTATTKTIVDNSSSQTLTNKTLTSPVLSTPSFTSYGDFTEISTPGSNPSSGVLRVYSKTDNNLYTLNSSGVELQISTVAPAVPSGTIQMWPGTVTPPAGYLICDGSAVSRTTYSVLFGIIGETWGQGDNSTTFNLPDFRGLFPRGVDQGAGRDPDASSRTAIATGGNSGALVGSLQTSNFASHNHTQNAHNHTQDAHNHGQNAHNHTQNSHAHGISDPGHSHSIPTQNTGGSAGFSKGGNNATNTATGDSSTNISISAQTATNISATATNNPTTATNQSATATNNVTGGNETRGINVYIYFIIKT